jgi:transposase
MYYAGLDVASKGSYLYAVDRRGRKVEGREIPTTKKSLREAFKKYKDQKTVVAIEAGGSTRWIHDELVRMGIGVYVVNPNKVKAIADSKRKTDKVDAKILSELLRIDALPERVYMAKGKNREMRDLMQARHNIIRSYTNLMNYLRGLLRQEGIQLPAKELLKEDYEKRLLEKKLPIHIQEIIERYSKTIRYMLKEKKRLEEEIKERNNKDVELVKSIPGMGEISAKTILAAIGEIKRFKKAKQLASYCGLVPSVRSSGERTEYGHITREGRSEVRRVGVQSAHAVLRSKAKETYPLKKWHASIAHRRGKKTALVALARKLVTIVFYVLRDRKAYDYTLLRTA